MKELLKRLNEYFSDHEIDISTDTKILFDGRKLNAGVPIMNNVKSYYEYEHLMDVLTKAVIECIEKEIEG